MSIWRQLTTCNHDPEASGYHSSREEKNLLGQGQGQIEKKKRKSREHQAVVPILLEANPVRMPTGKRVRKLKQAGLYWDFFLYAAHFWWPILLPGCLVVPKTEDKNEKFSFNVHVCLFVHLPSIPNLQKSTGILWTPSIPVALHPSTLNFSTARSMILSTLFFSPSSSTEQSRIQNFCRKDSSGKQCME